MKTIKRIILVFVLIFILISTLACGLKIVTNDGPTVKVTGPDQLMVGDIETYTATVTPVDKFAQNVTWDLSNNDLSVKTLR